MKTKSLFILSVLTFAMLSCKKDSQPATAVSSFNFSANGFEAPVTVTFANSSTNATSYAWAFGDGAVSGETNPTHTYTHEGHYAISLTASNTNGSSLTTQYITVQQATAPTPVAAFTFGGNASFAPCIVTFANASQNGKTYQWAFGDGYLSTDASPQHLYMAGGSYNVTLVVKNANGAAASVTKQINVTSSPTKCNITQVTLTAFPATNSGVAWDSGSAPDPYYEVGEYQSSAPYYSSPYFQDIATSSLPKTWTAYTIYLNNVDLNYQIILYDHDALGSEFMGGYYFQLRQFMPVNGAGYPSQIYIGGSGVSFTLSVEWKP